MGKRSANKVRFTAWVPATLAGPISAWLKENPGLNRTDFVLRILVDALPRHGIELPNEVIDTAETETPPRIIKMATVRSGTGKSFGILRAAAKLAPQNLENAFTSGHRLLLGSWIDQRLVAGVELLLRDRPHLNRSSFLTHAILNRLVKDGIITRQVADDIRETRKRLPPNAYEGVRFRDVNLSERGTSPMVSGDKGKQQDHRKELLKLINALSPEGFQRFVSQFFWAVGLRQLDLNKMSTDGSLTGVGVIPSGVSAGVTVFVKCMRSRWNISAQQIQEFRDKMKGQAGSGIFVVTGNFSSGALADASNASPPPIRLVDGAGLVNFLEEREIGVIPCVSYKIDKKFFDQLRE